MHKFQLMLLALLLAPMFAASSALADLAFEAGSISGHLVLVEDGSASDDPDEFAQAVVYFEPRAKVAVAAADQPLVMTTRRRQFEPRVLVLTAGSEVVFPNEDPILHNVFSSSASNRFDLGLYGRSEGKIHRFDQAGLVRVFCNVHPAMSAHIVVLDTPYFVVPESDGRFALNDLPQGPGRLTLWHERAEARHLELEVTAGRQDLGTTELALTIRQLGQQRERMRRPPRRGRY